MVSSISPLSIRGRFQIRIRSSKWNWIKDTKPAHAYRPNKNTQSELKTYIDKVNCLHLYNRVLYIFKVKRNILNGSSLSEVLAISYLRPCFRSSTSLLSFLLPIF